MTTTLAPTPAVPAELPVGARVSLDELATLGAEELTAALHRALPGADSGQIAVAAFNSSI
ncbi:FxSxx-COOH protein [Kitasatospora sp. NBC_01287]|uniref:FxSxx-COOH cyclophane-containing RiPP peptide n=1 Tax=Kitasatospora sp. NBC_01287 TaxID=2903573 RepID=UPI00225BEE41|nr:FxSxx-COOH cyclophane-containing RiPP peptide [Kitasatospora sp. NBC_01287]MCX4747292.1 FxSxx-COOH protein [Kitasatospora sp. NBC_01287]